jgi:hypothetical protein
MEQNRTTGISQDNIQKQALSLIPKPTKQWGMQLYLQDTFWGKMGFGDPALNMNMYLGHQWNIRVDEKIIKTFIIDERPKQLYTI